MRALVVHEPNRFSVEEVERPRPGRYELLCRVKAIAICGTDPHIIQGDFPGFWPKAFPFIPGHPTFEVLSYRSPQGIRAAGDTPWGAVGTPRASAT